MPTRDEKKSGSKQVAQKSKPATSKEISVEEGKASVSYTISITKNLGDYESLKIQAGITIPHGATDEMLKNLDDLMVTAREKVTSRLQADIEGITDSLNN